MNTRSFLVELFAVFPAHPLSIVAIIIIIASIKATLFLFNNIDFSPSKMFLYFLMSVIIFYCINILKFVNVFFKFSDNKKIGLCPINIL